MPADRASFSLIGRTPSEKIRNLVGLLFVLGILAYKYLDLHIDRGTRVDIAASAHGIKSQDDLKHAIQSFRIDPDVLASVARQIQSSPGDIQQNVTLHFVTGNDTALVIECDSDWPKDKLTPVCETFAADFKRHLQRHRTSPAQPPA